MTALYFLLIPIAAAAVWLTVQTLRQRKPTGVHSSVEAFQREMRALAPENDPTHKD